MHLDDEPPISLAPPTPPPRRRADRRSVRTASIDWKPPEFDSCDDVSMQEMDISGEREKPTKGMEKIVRELNVPDSQGTHKERLSKLIYVSLCILLVLFLINAAMVSVALWRVSCISPSDINIKKIELHGLDEATGRLSLSAELPPRWYYRLFNVIVHKMIIKLYVPEAVRREQDRWLPLLTLTVPRVDIGRGGSVLDWRGVPLELNHSIPLRNVVEYFSRQSLRRFDVRLQFEVETTSYLVPIRFSHSIQETVEIPPPSTTNDNAEMPKLDYIEFVHDRDPNNLAVRLHVRYPKKDIPEYLFVELPELYVDIGHYTVDPNDALEKNAFAQVKLLPHTIRHDCQGIDNGNAIFQISTTMKRKKAIVSLLERLRDRDNDWSISVGTDDKNGNHLQKWLSSISYEASFTELCDLFSGESVERLNKRGLEKEEEYSATVAAIDVGLVEIEDHGERPKFVAKVSLGHDYLRSLLGGVETKILRGRLPKVTIQAMLDRGDLSEGLTKVLTMDVLHQEPGESKTDILLHVELADASAVVKAGHKMARAKHLEHLAEELGEYRAIVLEAPGRGILPTMLRVFEVQLSLNHAGGLSFRRGVKRAIEFGDGNEAPVEDLGAESVKHDVNLDISSDADSITATGRVKFAKRPAIPGPFVYLYWEAMEISVYPVRSRQLDHIELMHLSVEKGNGRLSMAALSPLQILHHGSFEFVFSIHHTDTVIGGVPALIAAWRHLLLIYKTPAFPPIQVVGRIGKRKLDFETCLPPRSAFLSERTDWPRWVTDVIKTRVKIAGFYDATVQVLLELPKIGTCRSKKQEIYKTMLNLSVSIPGIHANGCLYPKGRNKSILYIL